MRIALDYIRANPGVCAAQVDRACRTARGGHQWMYRVVHRLIDAGLVYRERDGSRYALYSGFERGETVIP